MSDHFQTLGFPVHDVDTFSLVASHALQEGSKIPFDSGVLTCWELGEGLELWVESDDQGNLMALRPSFLGQSELEVEFKERFSPEICSYYGIIQEKDIIFELADYPRQGSLSLPSQQKIRLSALSHGLKVFKNQEEYRASPLRKPPQAADTSPEGYYFVCPELFEKADQFVSEPSAVCCFSGSVLDSELRVNSAFSTSYHWIFVETLLGELDVLAEASAFPEPLEEGQYIDGVFWLSGRLIESEPWIRKVFKRFFRR